MKLLRLVFVLALMSFLATNFPLGKLGVYSRFATLTLLIAGCLATVVRLRIHTLTPVLAAIYVFLTYSFVTVFWTENLVFSFAKWVLYGSLALAFLLTGAIIGQNTTEGNPFDPLKWSFLPMLISSVIALPAGRGWVEGNFRGYSGNSNALGASLMLTAPWLIYEFRRTQHGSRWRRRFMYCLAAVLALIMLDTHSRAAIISLLVLAIVASRQATPTRSMKFLYVGVSLLVLTYAVSGSQFFDRFYNTFVQKKSTEITSSREEQMLDSWEAAKQGGAFGAGFGISIGVSRFWNEGETFSSASREKGNSLFAIVEETGVVGLFFYAAILLTVFALLRKACRTPDPNQRFIALIAMGYFCAALVHGQFEAWFLSFGPDVSAYWATIGLAIGTLNRAPELVRNPVQVPAVLTTARA